MDTQPAMIKLTGQKQDVFLVIISAGFAKLALSWFVSSRATLYYFTNHSVLLYEPLRTT